jgi:acyl-[acyl-carrier-protein]-phospholipid O-acyltransferase/long-chain-fatty-acid--[acyl-carrier-protein] ligase
MNEKKLSGSFAWLNITQFLGALNDNVFKLLVIFLLVALIGEQHRTQIVSTASIVFVIPFLLFSHAGGTLADRISKRNIIVCLKILEIVITVLGCIAIYNKSSWGLYAIIFLLCTHSAFFSPSKYGIVPELVGVEKLSIANSLMEGCTYLAIIIGTFIPSFLLLNVFDSNFLGLGMFCVGVAVVGLLTSFGIEKTAPAGSKKPFTPMFVVEIFKSLHDLGKDRDLLLTILGSAYFIFVGAFIQQNTLLYGRDSLGLGWIESGYLFPVAALGIGLGALISGKLSGRNIEFGIVPIGAFGLMLSCMAMGAAPAGIKMARCMIFLIGLFSGMFIVPLNAFIQFRSPKQRLGEVLAVTNFLSFTGVALSAGALYYLNGVLKLSASECFVAVGALTAVLAVVTLIVLPDFLIRFMVLLVTKGIYRIKTTGLDNVPADGGALLVSNHVTWVDALLITATQQRRVRFLMGRDAYESRWLRPVFKLMKAIPISPKDGAHQLAESLKDARAALDDGYLVCIFAEGAMTRNGNMRAFRQGLERIVEGSNHPIIPVFVGNAWGSIFSYCNGKLFASFPKIVPYRVSVTFGPAMPATSTASEVRCAVLELSSRQFDLEKSRHHTLPAMFVRTARVHWRRKAIADTTGKSLTFGRTLAAAIALADELEESLQGQEKVGLLLPSSVGGALANIAVALSGRVMVNLNFTSSAESIRSAIRQCEIKTVISSRAFIEKLEKFEVPEGTVYLEDIMPRITGGARFVALLKAMFMPVELFEHYRRMKPDDLATVIFSSGSTGEPKGVMLSHHNIISNLEAFRLIIRFTKNDSMVGILPFFHSFGFTTTLWCPLVTGFRAMYHSNPLEGAKIAEIVRENRLTILLTTPTFLLAYIRRAKKEDFASLRVVIAGAEKLKLRTADAFEERFGVRPEEGYGATELSPVAAVSLPDVEVDGIRQIGTKEGSIGHPIPGCAVRIVDPVDGRRLKVGEQGVVMIKGPNVMMGYLKNPEKTAEVLQDGWYNTGDVGRMDEDGFVFLTDRLSRFSKIGGEMVPHVAIEEKYHQALNTANQVVYVTSAPDEKKGEQLIVFFTPEAGDAEKLAKIAAESDLPNLWKPRKENHIPVAAFPTLGSGKMDQKQLREMAKEVAMKRGNGETDLRST